MNRGEPVYKSCSTCGSRHTRWYGDSRSWYVCLDCNEVSNFKCENVIFSGMRKLLEESEKDKLYTWEDYEKD